MYKFILLGKNSIKIYEVPALHSNIFRTVTCKSSYVDGDIKSTKGHIFDVINSD
jgi:hypothetical protein